MLAWPAPAGPPARLQLWTAARPSVAAHRPPSWHPLHAGANVTFWGLTTGGGKGWPYLPKDCGFGPLLTFVGNWQPPQGQAALPRGTPLTQVPKVCTETGWRVERAGWDRQLEPRDLFAAMVATRKARLGV